MIIEFNDGKTEQINNVLEIRADCKRLLIFPKVTDYSITADLPLTYPADGIKNIIFDKPFIDYWK